MKGTMLAKVGVNLSVRPEMETAYEIVEVIYRRYGYLCVVTSGTDGKHMEGSLHYKKRALDFRTFHVKKSTLTDDMIPAIRKALGSEYDVVPEATHLHIEYDPK